MDALRQFLKETRALPVVEPAAGIGKLPGGGFNCPFSGSANAFQYVPDKVNE
jgi:hypothetical protein